ncbi:pectate lyase [Pseudomonas alliivorans]|uniref:pectate lyase n=1 Tax=Pseudomonas alliivorans TaxID=2810613 RepID=UPI001AE1ECF6|nr:pectate lyase [Pseudomonas alliivorans]MBP0941993.1 pectate lyase [Pseudomonas alliivorans]MEE4860339.1 pectate lyase [Pseudomonas alliivorans]MEE4879100.1 pectate lyase [Pseudomonas alliivorans]MEE4906186.1 pectate lyase [Pseudomonas alliivorans]MEE4931339.1 pectate lyase [Pseudomonas alliivorans]
MSDLTSLSGSMGNLSSLPGVGGTSMGIGASLAGAGQGAQGGQSALQELAGMLAEMLLGSGSGSGSGAGGGQSAGKTGQGGQSDLDSLLQSLQGNGQGGDKQTKDSGAAGGGEKELLTQVLMALFEKILGGSDSSSGAGNGSGGGSGGASGIGGGGTGASKDAGALGQGQGLGGTQGATGGSSTEDLVNTLMQKLGGGSLDNSIQPTADGGGEVSQNGKLKELLEMIAQFMDSHPETFNQPSDAAGKGGGGGGGGTPSVGGGGGGTPSVGGGGGGTPSVGGGGGGGGTPSVGGGGGGGGTPSVGGGGGGTPAPTGPTGTPSPTGPTGTGTSGSATPVSFPTASGTPTVVNETIKVGPGETFDGGGKTFTAGKALGDGGQGEGQKPMFELAEGATLKNVVLGDNAADGVHVRAASEKAVNVDNVHWTNVGEDALTVKGEGGAKVTNLNITNSSAQGANDKVFQLNADANVNVDNFKVKDFGTFMRTNGGQQGDWNLDLKNISAEDGKFSFVKSDSEGLNLTTSGIDLKNVENAYSKLPGSTNHKEA